MEKFETENDLRLTIKAQDKEFLVDEVCCTSINIILKNDGQIMTSFLGAHNPEIIRQLEKAQKLYFKEIKRTLKKRYNDKNCECGDECHCDENHSCGCNHGKEEKHECHCHDHSEKHDCGCHDKNGNKKNSCTCGDDCHCGEKNVETDASKKTCKKVSKSASALEKEKSTVKNAKKKTEKSTKTTK